MSLSSFMFELFVWMSSMDGVEERPVATGQC
jgi:hypothetical protein